MSEHGDQVKEQLQSHRIVNLDDHISGRVADEIRGKLLELSLDSREPITLLIDSNGGYAPHALFICDFIACLPAPVVGIVMGDCASMAVPILQSCAKRMALRHSMFFLHSISLEIELNQRFSKSYQQKLFDQRFEEGRETQRTVERLLAKRTGNSIKKIREMMADGDERDLHFSAERALAVNLIDEVAEYSKIFFWEK